MNVTVTERESGVYVIAVEGDVDMSTSPDLRSALTPVFKKNPSHIVVELSGVPYMDSSGIATLVEGLKLSKKGNVRFTLAAVTRPVEAVFELAYLKEIFEMAPDLEEVWGEKGQRG